MRAIESRCGDLLARLRRGGKFAATITAGAVAQNGNISAIRAYVDNGEVFTSNNPSATNSYQVSQLINVSPGNHHLVIVGYQDDGGAIAGDEYFSVGG